MTSRALGRAGCAGAVVSTVLVMTRAALADGADSVMVGAIAGVANLDDYELSPSLGEDEPKPLAGKNLRLDGTGGFFGAGLRGTIQSREGLRGGLGFGFFGASGLDMPHQRLASGLSVEGTGLWGVDVEAFLGKGFRAPPIYPYIDMRLAFDALQVNLELKSDAHGLFSSTTYDVLSLTLGPRLGVFIPVDHTFFLDVSASYGVFGAERATFFVGLGAWDGTIDRDTPSDTPKFPEERDE